MTKQKRNFEDTQSAFSVVKEEFFKTERTPPMTKPHLNQRIEWDGSETPPVPAGTEVTCWFDDDGPVREVEPKNADWSYVTAYMVHSYPPEDEVVDCWVECDADGDLYFWRTKTSMKGGNSFAHIRFTNGVAEIVSQEKA